MRDNIVILEKRELDIDGELINTSYTIYGLEEYLIHNDTFDTFQEAKEYLREVFNIL
jgi:hypothetical protein